MVTHRSTRRKKISKDFPTSAKTRLKSLAEFHALTADALLASQNTLLLGKTLLPSCMVHFASQLTFLLNTLYSLTHFTPQNTLLLRTLYSSSHFTPHHTLQLSSLCSSALLIPCNTLLPVKLCSLKNFATWNTLRHGTLFFLEQFALSDPECKVS